MNKLFNVLVIAGIPASLASCGANSGASGEDETQLSADTDNQDPTLAQSAAGDPSDGSGNAAAPNGDSAQPSPSSDTDAVPDALGTVNADPKETSDAALGDTPPPNGALVIDNPTGAHVPAGSSAANGSPGGTDSGNADSGNADSGNADSGSADSGNADSGSGPIGEPANPDGDDSGAEPASPDSGDTPLDCPPEQWLCEQLTCSAEDCNGCGAWLDPRGCSCDPSRPVGPEDCAPGTAFVCDKLDPSISEQGRISCACVPTEVSGRAACSENNPNHQTAATDDLLCSCAFVLIR